MGALEGKTIVIVGAGRGIGRAAALCCASEGAAVLVADNGTGPDGAGAVPGVADEVAKVIVQQGGRAEAFAFDATAKDAAHDLVARANTAFGRIDGAFYAAGIRRDKSLLRSSDDDLRAVLEVQLVGAMQVTRAVARALREQRSPGSIVLTTTAAALFGSTGEAGLCAASAGVIGFVKTAAAELARHDIRVNAIAPTARTRLTEALPLFQSIRPDSLLPEHVAPVVAFLLSDAARELRGEVLGVAGGRVYGFRTAETSGLFVDTPPVTLEQLEQGLRAVLRP